MTSISTVIYLGLGLPRCVACSALDVDSYHFSGLRFPWELVLFSRFTVLRHSFLPLLPKPRVRKGEANLCLIFIYLAFFHGSPVTKGTSVSGAVV